MMLVTGLTKLWYPRGSHISLYAESTVTVPAMGYAVIPHSIVLELTDGENIWLARMPGIFLTHGLIVDQGPIWDGPVATNVFNLSRRKVYIKKGEVVSYLLVL